MRGFLFSRTNEVPERTLWIMTTRLCVSRLFWIALGLCFGNNALAQLTDTTELKEVTVSAYRDTKPLLALPSSVSVLDQSQLQLQHSQSLVPAMNTVPGVTMEERSPGSYRLSIRGSLLRSPFGIRNVKIYVDAFPLTDAGGNTYLNLVDANVIRQIEIAKGPEASLYGAGTGGVVLLNPIGLKGDTTAGSIRMSGGSFGLFHQNALLQKKWNRVFANVSQGYQRLDGYRENSAMRRHYVHGLVRWNYSERSKAKVFGFYSDLNYGTPGGLTSAQFNEDPSQARLPTPFTPGAVEQKAGVTNKTLFGGVSNESQLTQHVTFTATLFGSSTDFTNPFITNYEERLEQTIGLRSFVNVRLANNKILKAHWQLGIEAAHTKTDIANYRNDYGKRDTLRTADAVNAFNRFAFTQLSLSLGERWTFEAALSVNLFGFDYKHKAPVEESGYNNVTFALQAMPRVALSYKITSDFALRASVSRGFSPPTIAEIRPSDNVVYTNLQAETGWNYETGLRFRTVRETLLWDASMFYFKLTNAIVRRVNDNDAEYFVNAGGTNQLGVESHMVLQLLRKTNGLVRDIQVTNALSLFHFTFDDYVLDTTSFSGNWLTGIPRMTSVSGLHVGLAGNVYGFVQHRHSGRVPLNDANTTFAGAFDVLQFKMGWMPFGKSKLELFGGIDNALNATYSLGNDLNAAGQRYHNAAPPRNYYGGASLQF